MLWYVLSLIGAIADAGYYISVKNYLRDSDPFTLAAGGYTCCGIILLSVSWFRGFPALGQAFFGALIVSSALGTLAILLSFAALRHTDISLAVPMISFTPLFLIITSFVLLGEVPSLMGIAGIIIIVTGSYVLNLSSSHTKLADPFRSVVKNRGVLYMLIVSVLYAVAINFDKIIVLNSDPVFGSSITCLIIGISFSVISQCTMVRDLVATVMTSGPDAPHGQNGENMPTPLKNSIGRWTLIGILLSVSAVSINTAYTLQIVPYVIAIKRMSIIIVVLYGAFVFGEKDMVRRLFGALLMVAGAVMIVLFE
jgi:drug/metabolite transporter (DMT)-like permease